MKGESTISEFTLEELDTIITLCENEHLRVRTEEHGEEAESKLKMLAVIMDKAEKEYIAKNPDEGKANVEDIFSANV